MNIPHSLLLDNTYEPIIAWELDGTIVYWNLAAEELYGFSSADAVGHNIHQLLQTVYPVPLPEVLNQLRSRRHWSGEFKYKTCPGLTLNMESHFALLELPTTSATAHIAVALQCDRDIGVYKRAEAAMRQVYEELENRVEERTCQLAAANKELESFSYSVSHDLRAPLRSLTGFARILMMDYAGKVLDTRATDLLKRMTNSVTRMGQLIEDLLKLSQVSRSAIHPQSLDLSAMAQAILDDVSARDSSRIVDIQVASGMTTLGDHGLLRLMLENLLGNAWKFTSKADAPRIEVGVSRQPGQESAYFVRDNGAGFDMEYARQLFAPFQRLHRATEFEGTGIGLATVQRVVHRHGGQIWAESSPGQGATFFFTLGSTGQAKRK